MCTLSGNETEGIKAGLSRICDKLFEKMDALQEKVVPNE